MSDEQFQICMVETMERIAKAVEGIQIEITNAVNEISRCADSVQDIEQIMEGEDE